MFLSLFLSLGGWGLITWLCSDTDNLMDTQVPFLPSVEVLVQALVVISSATLATSPRLSTQIMFCSHHPCLVSTAKRDAVWKRVCKCLKTLEFDVISIVSAGIGNLCKSLLGPMGLMSLNVLEQEAAINSLTTSMLVTPRDTYMEFEKHLKNLEDCHSHDILSETDIQLQTAFIKCLQDSTRTVCISAALALGKLSALSTRVDPLVTDLLSSLQASDAGVQEAILMILKGVVKHAGKSVGNTVKIRVYTQLSDLIHHDDDQGRVSAASILGILSQYMEAAHLVDLLTFFSNSQTWLLLRVGFLEFPSIVVSLKDEKFPLRETSTKALGRLLLHQVQDDPSKTSAYVDIISSI